MRTLSIRETNIAQAAAALDIDALSDILAAGTHHGRPGSPAREKQLAAKTMLRQCSPSTTQVLERLMSCPIADVREVAALVVAAWWPVDETLTPAVIRLGVDDDWEVREWAVEPLACLFRCDFAKAVERIRVMQQHPHPWVKRQIALGIRHAALARDPEHADTLLGLTGELLDEEDEYVRRNLGPFCIGDGLLRAYPAETLGKMFAWTKAASWAARWNVAMACSTAEAAKYPDEVCRILSALVEDADGRVLSGVRAATGKLARRQPDHEGILVLSRFVKHKLN